MSKRNKNKNNKPVYIVDSALVRRGIQTNISMNNCGLNVHNFKQIVDIFDNDCRLLIIRDTYKQILGVSDSNQIYIHMSGLRSSQYSILEKMYEEGHRFYILFI